MTESILGLYEKQIAEWRLLPSRGGVFEVRVDDRLVFSKKQTGRHPRDEEILDALAALVDDA